MKYYETIGRKIFMSLSSVFLAGFAALCLLPLIHLLAVSLSDGNAVAAGRVTLWPVNFSLKAYAFVLSKSAFVTSVYVSIKRLLLGVPINLLLIVMTAYPLSKDGRKLAFRNVYVWFFLFTMLFSGGLIPFYMVIKMTGMIDSIWALVIPGALPIFSCLILINYFRGLPKEIEEAAFIDGASHWVALLRVYIPLSLPSLATLTLFSAVGHWNSWFDGIILMNRTEHYPLQSYLQTVIVQASLRQAINLENIETLVGLTEKTNRAAQIFIGALPIMVIYPFLQRYFVAGIVLGSVKG